MKSSIVSILLWWHGCSQKLMDMYGERWLASNLCLIKKWKSRLFPTPHIQPI